MVKRPRIHGAIRSKVTHETLPRADALDVERVGQPHDASGT
jgi:hypothetical protein